jgi:WD40 repeat protein
MTASPEKTHVVKEYSHKSPLIACRFDACGKYIFASAEDSTVRRWDLATGKEAALVGHESWVFALASHPRGETIVTGGGDGQLIWWPATAEKPAPIRRVQAHRGWVRALAISPGGSIVASCGNDRMVRLWSFADGSPLLELPGHELPVYRVLFTPQGRTLISADLRGQVIEWDHRPGKEARRFDAGKLSKHNAAGQGVDYGGVRDLALSADGKYLACGGLIEATNPLGAISNPAVVVFDWQTGKETKLLRPKENVLGLISGLRFHPAGFLIAASGGNAGGHLWFWKPEQANELFHLNLPNTARDMDLHPDGMRIATAHHDGKVRVSFMGPK